jgi:diacylglycerol kinase (ATP)
MRTCVIFNPRAGSADQAEKLRDALAQRPHTVLRETSKAAEASLLSAQAMREGYDLIVAAGGDGTINEVVNGLAPGFGQVRLGILPLGTGNDLARTLSIPLDPLLALEALEHGCEQKIDLIEVQSEGRTAYCINVAAGGFSGQVDEILTEEMKSSWGPLAYVRGASTVLPNLKDYQTSLSIATADFEHVDALNIIVANGRTAAGGFEVAPEADPQDGLLDLVVVRYGSMLELAGVAARLFVGNYLDSGIVQHHRTERVRVASRPGMWFNVDGELLTNAPATFQVLPQAIWVLTGPEFDPAPEQALDE